MTIQGISKEQLVELCVNKRMPVSDVATYFGCGATTIRDRLKKYEISIPRRDRVTISKETLIDLYINQRRNTYEIAAQFKCAPGTIRLKLIKYDIKVRTQSEAQTHHQVNVSKSRLIELYVNQKMSVSKVSKLLGCNPAQITRKLKEYEIDIRSYEVTIDEKKLIDLYVNQRVSATKIGKMFDCSCATITRRLKKCGVELRTASERVKHVLYIDEKTLRHLYIDEHISTPELAEKFGVNNGTIRRSMIEYGIDRRSLSECKLGEYAPNWKGGISFEPYCPKFSKTFREGIREKFGRVCFLCGKTEKENGKKLSVHHVSYDKNCMCDGIECKFVPLCSSCHTKTNFNRDLWEQHFTYLLAERGLLQHQKQSTLQQHTQEQQTTAFS